MIGVRSYRPFPAEALATALADAKTVTVFEKDISYGYRGALASDLKAALFDRCLQPKFSSYVAGLGGRDVRPEQLAHAAKNGITSGPICGWIDVKG